MRGVKIILILFFVIGYFISAIFGDYYHTLQKCTVAGINDYGYYFVSDQHDKWIYAYYVWLDILLLLLFFTISRISKFRVERSLFVACTVVQLLRLIFQISQIFGSSAELMNRLAKSLSFQMVVIAFLISVYLIQSNRDTKIDQK